MNTGFQFTAFSGSFLSIGGIFGEGSLEEGRFTGVLYGEFSGVKGMLVITWGVEVEVLLLLMLLLLSFCG